MQRKLIAILVAGLFAPASALAADDPMVWNGSIEFGARGVDDKGDTRNGAYGTSATALLPFTGPRDGAKAHEYRDLDSTAYGVIDLFGANSRNYFRFFGENFGRDDQFLNARGGAWGVWRAQVYQDKLPHNLSWNVLSPLSNPTSTLQVGPAGAYPQAQNPNFWNSYNLGLQRNTTGGNVEVSANSPFFVRVDYNEVKTTGVRPQSAQLGTGSGNGEIDIGVPVEYRTKNSTVEAGYSGSNWNVKLGFLNSKFSNSVDNVRWTNFYMASQLDTTLLPEDNELTKWSLNASVRQLPLDSTLAARVTHSKLTSSFDAVASGLKPTGNQAPPLGAGYLVTTPTPGTFNGEHETTSASISLASTPLASLDTRIYYDYYDKDNNSTPIAYAAGGLGAAAATCPAANNTTRFCISAEAALEPFAYKKQDFGFDAVYRINKRHRILGGLDFLKVERELESAHETEDTKAWIEYRAGMSDAVTGRLKYQYLERRSEQNHLFTPSGTANPNTVPYFFSAYDVANFDQNQIRANIDWAPMDLLTLGFGATWKKTNYKDLQYYGRTDDRTVNYDFTVSYGDPNKFVVSFLGNWSDVEFNQAYHQGTGPFPNGVQTATDFDWGTENTQGAWLVALVADWVVSDRLSLKASASYNKTDGGVDFWSGNTAGAGGFQGGPLVNYVTDNTKMVRFNLKGDYRINRNWKATAGYAYEKYDYADDQMRGYQGYYGYYQNLGGTNNSWLSGAFTNPGYTLHVFYVSGTYSFD